MRCASLFMLLTALLLCPWGTASSEEGLILKGEDIVVVCDAPVEALARGLIRDYPDLRSRVEELLGWRFRAHIVVFLTADRERFKEMSGSPFISAFAVPARHAIAIRVSSLTARPYFFRETFQHELCHLVLHEHVDSDRLPKWLDEGVCQWISGSLGEILEGAGRGAAGAVDLARHAIPLKMIATTFPPDEASLILAYEESRSIVEYISTVHGKDSLYHILERLKSGDGIDQAIRASLQKSLDSLEEEWLREVRGKKIWLIWLGENIYEVVFLLAALLAILGFVRGMLRKQRYHKGDEDQNEQGGPEEFPLRTIRPRKRLIRSQSRDKAKAEDTKD